MPADVEPFLASGVSLDAPVSLFWSDEFSAGSTGNYYLSETLMLNRTFSVDTQQWQIFTNSYYNADNAVITDNGDLSLGLSNVLSSQTFTDPPYSGAKMQSKWSKVMSGEFKQEMTKFGYYEAKIQVPSDQQGRACRLR